MDMYIQYMNIYLYLHVLYMFTNMEIDMIAMEMDTWTWTWKHGNRQGPGAMFLLVSRRRVDRLFKSCIC
jgi:hypothetical protein